MQKKPSPQAGSAGNTGKPQGKGSFLRGFFKRFSTPDAVTDVAATQAQTPGTEKRQYSRQIIEEFIGRIHRQDAKIDFLDRVLKSSSDAIIVAEPNGQITMFNKGAEAMFQLDEDLAKGDNIFRLCADGSADGIRISRMLIADQTISNLRVEIAGIAGKRTPALLTIDFVRGLQRADTETPGEKTEPAAIIAIIKDISALEAAHSELEKTHAKLQEAYAKVEKLSLGDELTGLFNRRSFNQKVLDEYERMERGHMEAVSLLFIDIDHFKAFNDTYGHQVGDHVLRIVAEAIKDSVRMIDIACRYGGEEMVVILPATSEVGAWKLAERIRMRVASLLVPVGADKVEQVTISVGISTHRPGTNNVESFIHEADQAVYLAKQNGRNKTEAYQCQVEH